VARQLSGERSGRRRHRQPGFEAGDEVAIQSRLVNLPHQDPTDRFLAAKTLVYNLILVTADERLLNSPSIPTVANR
jgi:PIN domain nuclease of toxin-antitoxin system